MATRSSILPGEFHGQRSLMSYNAWGHKESELTGWLTLSLSSKIYLCLYVFSLEDIRNLETQQPCCRGSCESQQPPSHQRGKKGFGALHKAMSPGSPHWLTWQLTGKAPFSGLVFFFFFNWRIIALQYCVGFCHTLIGMSPLSWTSLLHPYTEFLFCFL